jgi:hypothetical protein
MRKSTYSTYSVSSSRSWFRWMGIIVIFGAFSGLLWYATSNRDALLRSEDDLDLILPIASPVKVRADNPGGMEVDNRDKQVFNLLDSSTVRVDIEKEELCAGENSAALCNKKLPKVTALAADPQKAKQVETENQVKPKSTNIALLIENYEEVETVSQNISDVENVSPEVVSPIQPNKKIELVQSKTVKPKLELASQQALFTGGAWGVQLASYRNLSSADKGAKIFLKKYSEILKPLTYVTEKIEIPEKGTFYRVQFIGLKDKIEAKKACDIFKLKGQGCWYVSR